MGSFGLALDLFALEGPDPDYNEQAIGIRWFDDVRDWRFNEANLPFPDTNPNSPVTANVGGYQVGLFVGLGSRSASSR